MQPLVFLAVVGAGIVVALLILLARDLLLNFWKINQAIELLERIAENTKPREPKPPGP